MSTKTTTSATNILTTEDLDIIVEDLEAYPVVRGFQPEARYAFISLLNAMGINATGSFESVLMNALRAIGQDLEDAETVAVARPFRASQMRQQIQLKLDAVYNFLLTAGEQRDGVFTVVEAPPSEVKVQKAGGQ